MAIQMGKHEKKHNEISNNQKPILAKYASTHGEKKLLPKLSGEFDKNLTIEKTRFDSSSGSSFQPPTSSTSTPVFVPQQIAEKQSHVSSLPSLTTSVISPIVTKVQSGPITTSKVNTTASQSTPLLSKPLKNKAEDRRQIKRKKPPPMSGTATPSEVFHRNLVDAVSNVEDSDENEQYVYPYSGNNTDPTGNSTDTIHRTASPSLYRPQSTRSFANSSQHETLYRKPSTNFFSDLFQPILLKSQSSKSTLRGQQDLLTRPKLRNYIMDHHPNKLNSNEWIDGRHSPPLSRRSSTRGKFYSHYGTGDAGYTTDDEEAQHMLTLTVSHRISLPNLQQIRHRNQKMSTCYRYIVGVTITIVSFILLVLFILFYFAKPLRDITVEMEHVLSSEKELIFDLRIRVINSNLWTIQVADTDMSVFAYSQAIEKLMDEPILRGSDPAEYLGGFYHFDEPLSFPSSFYTNKPVTAVSQIRIKSPGADKSGNERWSRIIRYPYGLVVRGVLSYKPLSFLSLYPQSVAICNIVEIDPATGEISEDPDQAFCLSDEHTGKAAVNVTQA